MNSAKYLDEMRDLKGFSVELLCQIVNISPFEYMEYIAGRKELGIGKIIAISEALGVRR